MCCLYTHTYIHTYIRTYIVVHKTDTHIQSLHMYIQAPVLLRHVCGGTYSQTWEGGWGEGGDLLFIVFAQNSAENSQSGQKSQILASAQETSQTAPLAPFGPQNLPNTWQAPYRNITGGGVDMISTVTVWQKRPLSAAGSRSRRPEEAKKCFHV